jgi:hypothetical protein
LDFAPGTPPKHYQNTTKAPPKRYRWNRAAGGMSLTQRGLMCVSITAIKSDYQQEIFQQAAKNMKK